MKKAILFTSQQGTTISLYFATYEQYENLPAWLPPEGPDVDLKPIVAGAFAEAKKLIPDAEVWKLPECSIKQADIADGKYQFQYAYVRIFGKSKSGGWKYPSYYLTLDGQLIEPEVSEFPDRKKLEAYEKKMNKKYGNWAE